MTISIRQALPKDASFIAPLIYDAIGEIANRLTGERETAHIIDALQTLVEQMDNRHTYTNTFVALESDSILGIVVLYDGKQGALLDRQLEQWLATKNAHASLDREAHDDEYYIDTICVSEAARGKGIGTLLLEFAEETARALGYKKISLNVEVEKLSARRLYERMGYVITGPWTIINEPFHHMVKQLD